MKSFNFSVTSTQFETLDRVISGLLPHANFSLEEAKAIVDGLFQSVPIEETYGIYYVFLKLFDRLSVLRHYMSGYSTVLNREVFEAALSANLEGIVKSPEFNARKFFEENGQSFNMEVPKELYECKSYVFSEALRKYDELFDLAVPTAECTAWLTTLRNGMEYDLTTRMLSLAGKIVTDGVKLDRDVYNGPADARKFLSAALTDVNARVYESLCDHTNRFTPTLLSSYAESCKFTETNQMQIKPLYYMGFEPIDTILSICTQDIVNIVAEEGVGKTRLVVDQIYKMLMQGVGVLVICGETAKVKIKAMIESAHIYNLSGYQLDFKEILDPSTIKTSNPAELEQLLIAIHSAQADLYDNPKYGKLTPVQSAYYETFLEDIKKYKAAYDFSVVVVDHVLALESNASYTTLGRLTTESTRVTYLYECESVLVKECNIAFINTTHPSTKTSQELLDGKAPSTRTGGQSSSSSKYASIIFVITDHYRSELKKQDIILMYANKLRDYAPITDACVLRRQGCTSIHVYDPEIQYLAKGQDAKLKTEDLDALAFGIDGED